MDRELLAELYGDDLLLLDGFDDCLKGIVTRYGQEPIACYGYNECLDTLTKDMTRDEAIEYFEFNVIGAWMGDRTPCFIEDLDYV